MGNIADRKKKGTPFKKWLGEELKDPEFKRLYEESPAK